MKSVIAAVICAVAAFVGMYLYLQSQRSKADASAAPLVTDAELSTAIAAKSEPTAPKAKKTSSSPSKPAEQKLIKPSKELYYTVVRDFYNNPVPKQITIHNTIVGDFTINLIGAGSRDGSYFIVRGTTSDAKKYRWEIEMIEGEMTVTWEGQKVPPVEDRKRSASR